MWKAIDLSLYYNLVWETQNVSFKTSGLYNLYNFQALIAVWGHFCEGSSREVWWQTSFLIYHCVQFADYSIWMYVSVLWSSRSGRQNFSVAWTTKLRVCGAVLQCSNWTSRSCMLVPDWELVVGVFLNCTYYLSYGGRED